LFLPAIMLSDPVAGHFGLGSGQPPCRVPTGEGPAAGTPTAEYPHRWTGSAQQPPVERTISTRSENRGFDATSTRSPCRYGLMSGFNTQSSVSLERVAGGPY
jgi:hypothetical protein